MPCSLQRFDARPQPPTPFWRKRLFWYVYIYYLVFIGCCIGFFYVTCEAVIFLNRYRDHLTLLFPVQEWNSQPTRTSSWNLRKQERRLQ